MKTFYVLIDIVSGMQFGWTFDEQLARTEANNLSEIKGIRIDVYEFQPHDEFQRD